MAPNIEDTFVLIVGGGPVGLTLAIDLGQRGVPAILVSQNKITAQHPKCNFSNTRTMEHLRRMGVAADVSKDGLPPNIPRAISYRTRFSGQELGRFDVAYLAQGGVLFGPERGHTISQQMLEPILKRHAEAQAGVDIRFGQRLVSLEYGPDGATATVEDVDSGAVSTIRARYVAGCDGARSPARQAIGATMIGEDGTAVRAFVSGTMMAYFIRSANLYAKSPAQPAIMSWIINHDVRGFVMSQNGVDRFLVHYQVPPDVDWQSLDTDDVLRRMLGPDIDVEVLSSGPWTGGLALIADKYQDGPVFLAGDAAHLFTPLGGFGMNTGIGDAVNLGWKLAAVYHGWGGAGLLDTYQIERHAIGERNSRIGIHCAARKDRWRIPANIEDETPEAEAARKTFGAFVAEDDKDEYLTIGVQLGERYVSPIIAKSDVPPPEDPWDRYVPSDEPGGRAPHFTLPDGRSLYDAFGADFAVLAFGDTDPSSIADAARARGVPLRTVRAPERDPQYRHDLVLVRPDGQIAWSGDAQPADSLGLIDMVRGA